MDIDINDITGNLGISELSPMQEDVFQQDARKDLVLLSPTGSGKTIAYMLQVFKSIERNSSCLVVVPSRELAIQTFEQFKKAKTGLRIACCYGGRPIALERRAMETGNNIIIGTPGRICDHLQNKSINPKMITIWVVDEFDKALELGFKEQMEKIHNSLTQVKKKILLSATYDDYFKHYITLGKGADMLDYRNEDSQPKTKHYIVRSQDVDKATTLISLLHDIGAKQSIVFFNHRESVDRISKILRTNRICHAAYHGGMEQIDREKALSRFRSKSAYTMVTTDLAARGLDIDNVDVIIHYNLPHTREAFVHRNGRTARWQAEGSVFTIVNEKDSLHEWIADGAEEYATGNGEREIPRPQFTTIYIGKGKLDNISKGDIMGFLCKKASLNRDEIGLITVKERFSLAAVSTSKVKQTLKLTANEKLKNKKAVIEIAND